jgi:hypothetical protein
MKPRSEADLAHELFRTRNPEVYLHLPEDAQLRVRQLAGSFYRYWAYQLDRPRNRRRTNNPFNLYIERPRQHRATPDSEYVEEVEETEEREEAVEYFTLPPETRARLRRLLGMGVQLRIYRFPEFKHTAKSTKAWNNNTIGRHTDNRVYNVDEGV